MPPEGIFSRLLHPFPRGMLEVMKRTALSFVVAGMAMAPWAAAQDAGLPGLDQAARWYNTPPLTQDDLKEKAVLFEVFRTW